MKQQLTVIKIGGNVINQNDTLEHFLTDFAKISEKKILIHGGGKLATQIAYNLGVETQMIDGRRVTNAEMLKVATMVYAGYINKNIVAQLQCMGCNAIGLTGADLNTIKAHKRKTGEIDFGFVGDVDEVNSKAINNLLNINAIPVFTALTHNQKGQLLNTNADTIAQSIAVRMCKLYNVKLIYCFEKPGVLTDVNNENSYIENLSKSTYNKLINKGIIAEGMKAKLENCFTALHKGVDNILICKSAEIAKKMPVGTHISIK